MREMRDYVAYFDESGTHAQAPVHSLTNSLSKWGTVLRQREKCDESWRWLLLHAGGACRSDYGSSFQPSAFSCCLR